MTFGQQAKSVLGAIAPILGGALGGPFGAAAGLALQKALGANDPKALEAAITSGDPDILVKLKQADNDFKVQMASLGVDEEKLIYDDKASARAREEAVKDKTPAVLAAIVTAGFFGVLGWLLYKGKPPDGEVIMLLVGSLSTAWTGIVSYYFGSSSGSAAKSATIDRLAGAK